MDIPRLDPTTIFVLPEHGKLGASAVWAVIHKFNNKHGVESQPIMLSRIEEDAAGYNEIREVDGKESFIFLVREGEFAFEKREDSKIFLLIGTSGEVIGAVFGVKEIDEGLINGRPYHLSVIQ